MEIKDICWTDCFYHFERFLIHAVTLAFPVIIQSWQCFNKGLHRENQNKSSKLRSVGIEPKTFC